MPSPSSSISSSASCGSDSPLSIVGNISGILTFGFALLVGIQIRANAFRNAKYEMLEMKSRLESRTRDVYALQVKIINAVEKHDQFGAPLELYLKRHLTNLIEEIRQPMREAQALLGRVLSEERFSGLYRVVYSTRFVVERTAIQRCLEVLDYRVSNLREAASDALDWDLDVKEQQRYTQACLMKELELMKLRQSDTEQLLEQVLQATRSGDLHRKRSLSL